MRTILKGLGWVLVCAVVLVAVILGEAHLEMRRVVPPLPEWSDLDALRQVGNGPSRVRYVNTASQAGSGPATVAHPAFVLEWSDGRSFLIDAGMDREYALEFGRLGERHFDGEPIVPHGSVTEQLGPAAATVRGIAFTPLHSDHTNGVHGLCDALELPLSVFQTPWQADRENYTTFSSGELKRLASLMGSAR